jgi:uncharacterized membrane protein HdeD (DUF308 family)
MNDSQEILTNDLPWDERVRQQRGTILAIGIFTILAGVAAIIVPRLATLAVELMIGVILVISGILQGMYAWQIRTHREWLWKGLGALLACAVGLWLLVFPLQGVLTLTLLVGLFFLLNGGMTIMLALHMRSWSGWGWILTSGLVSLLLGFLVFLLWPEGAGWVLGILIGIDLIMSGWWLLALAGGKENRGAAA